MRNTLLATAVAAALAMTAPDASAAAGSAATKADIQAMQAQMQALAERMNRLEAANTQLQTENQQLRAVVDQREAEVDYLKEQTKELRQESAQASADLGKVKGADWASRIKLKGDLRMRGEYIGSERVVTPSNPAGQPVPQDSYVDDAEDRYGARFRARLGVEAQVTDNSRVVMQLASGSGDPRSTNQTLTGEASGKGIWIDLAYADWTFAPGGDLILGKQKHAIWRPAYSMFWDNDVNPEGVAVTYNRGMFFGSAYAWLVQENHTSNPSYDNTDPTMYGTQLGLRIPVLGGEATLAAHYSDLTHAQGSNPFYNGNAFGNTTVRTTLNGVANTPVLAYDYNVVQLTGALATTLLDMPLLAWADWAQNTASGVDYSDAWSAGAFLGKASDRRTWEAGFMYQSIDKDALYAQWIDSDFAGGVTDADGWVLKFGYAPVKNVVINGTYFLNTQYKDVAAVSGVADGTPYSIGRDLDYDRLQIDVNYRF